MGKVMVVHPLRPRSNLLSANKATQIQSVLISSYHSTFYCALTKQIYTLMTAHLSPPERPK